MKILRYTRLSLSAPTGTQDARNGLFIFYFALSSKFCLGGFFDTPIVTFSLSFNHFAVAFYANDSSAESKLLSPCTLSARQNQR